MVALTSEQKDDLVAFLCYWFGFTELQEMGFDLGLEFELFSQESKVELVEHLVRHVERQDRLACLVDWVRASAPEADLSFLPDPVSGCVRHRKLEVLLPGGWDTLRLSKLRRALARAYKVPEGQVSIVCAAGPRVRLLVSLPDNRPSEMGDSVLRPYHGAVVRPFEKLDRAARRAWRAVAIGYPVEQARDGLLPAAQWGEVRRQTSRRVLGRRLGLLIGVGAAAWGGYALAKPWVPALERVLERELLRLVQALLPWVQFLGSVVLSVAGLAWLTVALFAGLALFLRALPAWIDRASRGRPSRAAWLRWRDGIDAALTRHPRIVGTLFNLLSGTLALSLFSMATGSPLDEWDLGIQAGVSLLIELVVLGAILRIPAPSTLP